MTRFISSVEGGGRDGSVKVSADGQGKLTRAEAGEQLEMSESTFRRYVVRYEAQVKSVLTGDISSCMQEANLKST